MDVREADAGGTGAYADAVPAELVLLVGIMGNVTDADLARTIAAAPALCAPGGRWCGRAAARAATATAWCARALAAAGFAEIAYDVLDENTLPAVGAARYDGPPAPPPRRAASSRSGAEESACIVR